jgi:hypothetical protein
MCFPAHNISNFEPIHVIPCTFSFKIPYYSDTLRCVTYSQTDTLNVPGVPCHWIPNQVDAGPCLITRCLIDGSFLIFRYSSDLLYSWVFQMVCSSHLTMTCFLSRVTLQLTSESFGKAVCSSLTWGPATSREAVVEDCPSAIYKAD